MSKYRKIESRIWNDEKFNSLSDRGKLLFFFLLTHPHLTALGAMRASIAGLAQELNWVEKDFREAFEEIFSKSIVMYDEKACFVWLPNFLKYNKPENPNVVKSWDKWLEYLPECDLKNKLVQSIKNFVKALGEAFAEALPEAFVKGMANHEHEHEHEHEINICRVAKATQPISQSKKEFEEIKTVFEYWQVRLNHPRARLDQKRSKKIEAALKQDYSAEDLKQAIDGCANSRFHMGENAQSQSYDGIDLIFRDAEHIEKFIDLAKASSVKEMRRMALDD